MPLRCHLEQSGAAPAKINNCTSHVLCDKRSGASHRVGIGEVVHLSCHSLTLAETCIVLDMAKVHSHMPNMLSSGPDSTHFLPMSFL
jgi:hypothetical protein